MKPRCRHCKTNQAIYGRRSLCLRCFNDKSIRNQYERTGRGGIGLVHVDPDETLEDLERLIESRRPTMPKKRYGEE